MPIRVVCPSCAKGINAPDSRAGTSGKCPACGTSVSIPAAAPLEPLTIEATGKKWKLLQLVGVVGILISMLFIFLSFALYREGEDHTGKAIAAAIGLMISIPVYAAGRVGAWWYHG
jgi:hypothetical protein